MSFSPTRRFLVIAVMLGGLVLASSAPAEAQREYEPLFNKFNFEGHLTTSKYARIAKCSNDTALRDIRALLDRGIIVKNPDGGRSTSYRLVEADHVPE